MKHFLDAVVSELQRFAARRLHRGFLIAIPAFGIGILALNISRGEEIRFAESLEATFVGLAFLFVILGVSIGASFFAAEWNTGSIGTAVTFDPSRIRVLLAKAVAAAIGTALILAAVFVVMAGALAVGATASGTFERNTTHELFSGEDRDQGGLDVEGVPGEELVYLEAIDDTPVLPAASKYTLRAMGGAALAAAFGVAMGALVRRTAAVVGGLLLLAIVGEASIAALLKVEVFWGPARSLITVTAGNYEWLVLGETSGPALLYALMWTAAATVGALAWFARTEVATGPR